MRISLNTVALILTSAVLCQSAETAKRKRTTVVTKTITMVTTNPAPEVFDSWELRLNQPCYGAMSFELLRDDSGESLVKHDHSRAWSAPCNPVSHYNRETMPKDLKNLRLIVVLEYEVGRNP